MTDVTQEFNEASKNKVRMRIFFDSKSNLHIERLSIALIFEIRGKKLFKIKKKLLRLALFVSETKRVQFSLLGKVSVF